MHLCICKPLLFVDCVITRMCLCLRTLLGFGQVPCWFVVAVFTFLFTLSLNTFASYIIFFHMYKQLKTSYTMSWGFLLLTGWGNQNMQTLILCISLFSLQASAGSAGAAGASGAGVAGQMRKVWWKYVSEHLHIEIHNQARTHAHTHIADTIRNFSCEPTTLSHCEFCALLQLVSCGALARSSPRIRVTLRMTSPCSGRSLPKPLPRSAFLQYSLSARLPSVLQAVLISLTTRCNRCLPLRADQWKRRERTSRGLSLKWQTKMSGSTSGPATSCWLRMISNIFEIQPEIC